MSLRQCSLTHLHENYPKTLRVKRVLIPLICPSDPLRDPLICPLDPLRDPLIWISIPAPRPQEMPSKPAANRRPREDPSESEGSEGDSEGRSGPAAPPPLPPAMKSPKRVHQRSVSENRNPKSVSFNGTPVQTRRPGGLTPLEVKVGLHTAIIKP
eukprot:1192846-Prorocentrum_minimum.AAC.1